MQQTTRFEIEGMSCGACVKGVTSVLSRMEGVVPKHVEVGSAEVSFEDSQTSSTTIAEALTAAGYPARPRD